MKIKVFLCVASIWVGFLMTGGTVSAHDGLKFVIEYRDGKFTPDRLEIPQRSQVTFANLGTQPVWPASNIHPTHQIYPEFDPKRPITAGESWSFVFDKPGTWRFHNHLSSSEGGVISIIGAMDIAPQPMKVPDLSSVHLDPLPSLTPEQNLAWLEDPDEKIIFDAVKQYGPAAVVKVLSEIGLDLNKDCHQRAHLVGRSAYKIFGPLAFGLSGHECMSGSFHGAMEAMLWDRGARNLGSDVSEMCSVAQNGFFRHQCVHGAGHGLTAWTDYQLPEALGLCDQLSNYTDRQSCYSGVFMENIVGGLSGQGGMGGHFSKYISDDPHFPCNAVDEKYVSACYGYQSSRMAPLYKYDFNKVSQACEAAPEKSRKLCFYSMGRDVDAHEKDKLENIVADCSFTKVPVYHSLCMEGAVQNKFWEASSGEKAIDFCKFLTDAKDKESCYTTILNRAKAVMTTPEEMRWFCSMVEPGYHYRIPLPVLAHLIGEKLFNLKPTKESVAINSCYRPLPQLDKLLARWTKT